VRCAHWCSTTRTRSSFKHFRLGLPKETPVTVKIIGVYRDLRTKRDKIAARVDEAARTAVARLKQAGVSVATAPLCSACPHPGWTS
jgi:tRNA(Ser,Leu) C12 N-acetylase TAN1